MIATARGKMICRVLLVCLLATAGCDGDANDDSVDIYQKPYHFLAGIYGGSMSYGALQVGMTISLEDHGEKSADERIIAGTLTTSRRLVAPDAATEFQNEPIQCTAPDMDPEFAKNCYWNEQTGEVKFSMIMAGSGGKSKMDCAGSAYMGGLSFEATCDLNGDKQLYRVSLNATLGQEPSE